MRFNDAHGHQSGDAALCMVANILRDGLPKAFVVGRYAGDGFAILMPGVALADAHVLVDGVRESVAMSPLLDEGRRVSITMSAGLASIPDATITTPKDLVKRADEHLDAAKRAGRNRTRAALT